MQPVNTVLGPVDSNTLGMVAPHEHMVAGNEGWRHDPRETRTHDALVAECIENVVAGQQAGLKTVFDCTPADLGRDVSILRDVSHETGLNIVCATGLYCRRPTPYFTDRTVPELADWFQQELESGIAGTSIRAGFIKVAVENAVLTPYEERVLEAAARASVATAAPIVCHTEPGAQITAATFLRENGVAGNKVVIGHADGTTDMSQLLHLIERLGVYVAFDRFGLEKYGRDDVRLATVAALCQLGRASRVLLSSDHVSTMFGRDRERLIALGEANPNHRLPYVAQTMVPALRERGVADEQIRQMTHRNPVDMLTAEPETVVIEVKAPGF